MEHIAELTGYKNAFYLSRVFTKNMSMTPSLYRKTNRI
jgi:YesN/AraC family two-component response regulator